jgi:hypothetical protein
MSIPMVQKFYERNKGTGLIVLGINIDEDPSGVYAFVKQFQMSYTVVLGGASSVPQDFRVEGIPLFIFVDPKGRITQRWEGFGMGMAGHWQEELDRMTSQSA